MKEIYRKYKKNKRLIKQMNRCRIAVQARTLVDITDSEGKEISEEAMQGQKPTHRRSKIYCRTMGRIRKKYWKEWKDCIREIFCIRGTNKLKQELGNWNDTQAQEWDTYVYRSTNKLIWRRVEGVFGNFFPQRQLLCQNTSSYDRQNISKINDANCLVCKI